MEFRIRVTGLSESRNPVSKRAFLDDRAVEYANAHAVFDPEMRAGVGVIQGEHG